MSNLLTAPVEIWYEILGYLNKPDVANVSLCSKLSRNLVLPSLFAGLKLTPESAAAFGDGELCSLRGGVRKVYLIGTTYSGCHGESCDDTVAYIETFRRCIESLRLFPALRGVCLEYGFYLWRNLYVAFWREISGLRGIREVEVVVVYSIPFRVHEWGRYEEVHAMLEPSTQQFVGSQTLSEGEANEEIGNIQIGGSGLEVVRLSPKYRALRLDTIEKYFFDVPVKQSFSTLRELSITASRIANLTNWPTNTELGPQSDTYFPNLTNLEISAQYNLGDRKLLSWISVHCPNLHTLGLITPADARYASTSVRIRYTSAFPMPKLAKLYLSWPWAPYTVAPSRQEGRFKRKELDAHVRKFISAGMYNLKEVVFLGRRDWMNDLKQFIVGGCGIEKHEVSEKTMLLWKKSYYTEVVGRSGVRSLELGEEDGGGVDSEDEFDSPPLGELG
ncbi:hypothetical protein TWF481_012097 [Arthrobotrys musiformis]|uniref:F-box domain-containing protein n=1 Tax=Arthrobotrys musiformis TaxID=47236 RepID=A0AAV9VY59_9PEZI